MNSSRLIRLALVASVLAHVVIYFAFSRRPSPPPAHAGLVSVEFVTPVVHGAPPTPAPARPRPRAAKRSSDEDVAVTRSASPTAPPASTVPVTASLGSGETARFLGEVSRLINARKTYPRVALDRELEGRVVVAITLNPNGDLLASAVEEPSSYQVLNDAALGAVRAVGHFPKFPPSAGEKLHLHVPLNFKISR